MATYRMDAAASEVIRLSATEWASQERIAKIEATFVDMVGTLSADAMTHSMAAYGSAELSDNDAPRCECGRFLGHVPRPVATTRPVCLRQVGE